MNTTNERIFAKDTDMMFWQQDNCTQCAKAVWYNARLGRCPKHNCALTAPKSLLSWIKPRNK